MPQVTKQATDYISISRYYSANNQVPIAELDPTSDEQYLWYCSKCDREWTTSPAFIKRTGGCSCRFLRKNKKSILLTHPDLKLYWADDIHSMKNYSAGSVKIVNWKNCDNDPTHQWAASISTMIKRRENYNFICNDCIKAETQKAQAENLIDQGIPFIAETKHIQEWSDKNTLDPNKVFVTSSQKVWWKCAKCGTEWKAPARYKARRGYKCYNCSRNYMTSQIESKLRESLRVYCDSLNTDHTQLLPIKRRGRFIQGDIFGVYKGYKIAIEYDGSYWHKDRYEQDQEISHLILENGYILIRVRECHGQQSLTPLEVKHHYFHQISYDYSLDDTNVDNLSQRIITVLNQMIDV